jgi:hypothetical protein
MLRNRSTEKEEFHFEKGSHLEPINSLEPHISDWRELLLLKSQLCEHSKKASLPNVASLMGLS